MTIFAILVAVWLAVGTWLFATKRAGYDIHGNAPWHVRGLLAPISTIVIAPGLYLFVLITGKDI